MVLSFIVPCYNCATTINRAITSIYNLNMPISDFEIIAIDDGSSDNTYEILKTFQSKFTNFTALSHINIGAGLTRNVGIKLAKGKYIQFVDSDDYLECISLDIILNRLKNDNLDILALDMRMNHSDIKECDGSLNTDNIIDITMCGEAYILSNKFMASPCAYIFKTEFLRSNSLYYSHVRGCEDIDHTIITIFNAKRIKFLNRCLYVICPRPDSLSNKFNLDFEFSMLDVIENGLIYFNNNQRYHHNYLLQYAVSDWLVYPLKVQINHFTYADFKSLVRFIKKGSLSAKRILTLSHLSHRDKKQEVYLKNLALRSYYWLFKMIARQCYAKLKRSI